MTDGGARYRLREGGGEAGATMGEHANFDYNRRRSDVGCGRRLVSSGGIVIGRRGEAGATATPAPGSSF